MLRKRQKAEECLSRLQESSKDDDGYVGGRNGYGDRHGYGEVSGPVSKGGTMVYRGFWKRGLICGYGKSFDGEGYEEEGFYTSIGKVSKFDPPRKLLKAAHLNGVAKFQWPRKKSGERGVYIGYTRNGCLHNLGMYCQFGKYGEPIGFSLGYYNLDKAYGQRVVLWYRGFNYHTLKLYTVSTSSSSSQNTATAPPSCVFSIGDGGGGEESTTSPGGGEQLKGVRESKFASVETLHDEYGKTMKTMFRAPHFVLSKFVAKYCTTSSSRDSTNSRIRSSNIGVDDDGCSYGSNSNSSSSWVQGREIPFSDIIVFTGTGGVEDEDAECNPSEPIHTRWVPTMEWEEKVRTKWREKFTQFEKRSLEFMERENGTFPFRRPLNFAGHTQLHLKLGYLLDGIYH